MKGNGAAFNQYTVDAVCRLCQVAPENSQHFIAECSPYTPESDDFIEKLRNNLFLPDAVKIDLQKPEILTQLTLDASVYVTKQKI